MFCPLASMNAFVIAYTQSDFFGKVIIWGLIVLSMICWIVLLHKWWTMRQVQKFSLAFQQAIENSKESILTLDPQHLPRPKLPAIPHPFNQIYHEVKNKTIEVLNKNHYF